MEMSYDGVPVMPKSFVKMQTEEMTFLDGGGEVTLTAKNTTLQRIGRIFCIVAGATIGAVLGVRIGSWIGGIVGLVIGAAFGWIVGNYIANNVIPSSGNKKFTSSVVGFSGNYNI